MRRNVKNMKTSDMCKMMKMTKISQTGGKNIALVQNSFGSLVCKYSSMWSLYYGGGVGGGVCVGVDGDVVGVDGDVVAV